ncbi:MAG: aminopeptidase [Candidatus Izemoplasmatales bacterium]|jgi:aminopeptidase|nr:aminopeptidase [Candidatus Izemoplasmatales bacterium]MDD4988476.1 aminopeptidase [Candidatus Izemoplasmatales bacterium]MDY0372999.1 aminopeptidase [Candidatus Izemoplasmatales bacterium]NLF49461.1 aminopeptidase [Acholeplasmataceae bacterium]
MLKDPRLDTLAKTLVQYSVAMQQGETVLISASIKAKPLILALLKTIRQLKGNPIVELSDDEINREILLSSTDKSMDRNFRWLDRKLDDIDCIIHIRASESDYTSQDVSSDIKMAIARKMNPLTKKRLAKKWVLLNYPTEGGAHKARLSYEKYFDFIVDVSSVDYSKMNIAFQPLKELMEKTDQVHIIAKNTDLSFSIKGMNAIPCAGNFNIPDGEIFTAPVKNSVNGTITYNTPSPERGTVFTNVSLTFKDGKIIEATADQENELLQKIFDTDEGSRYVGEFAIGVNPLIDKPMGDILFDEKIAGSIHFTPGRCYEDAPNGNDSAIHWDLVQIQTPEYGGGEIYFDGRLIRKDGRFVLPELFGLNPENLR